MSLGDVFPFEFYEIHWEGEVLVLLRMFGKILRWSHPVQCFCFLGSIFITFSILSGVICLFRASDSSWFSCERLYVSSNSSILPRLSSLLAYSCSWYFLKILYFSMMSVVAFPFSFLILFIWALSLFFLDESG